LTSGWTTIDSPEMAEKLRSVSTMSASRRVIEMVSPE
jgi:hypothetical protein